MTNELYEQVYEALQRAWDRELPGTATDAEIRQRQADNEAVCDSFGVTMADFEIEFKRRQQAQYRRIALRNLKESVMKAIETAVESNLDPAEIEAVIRGLLSTEG